MTYMGVNDWEPIDYMDVFLDDLPELTEDDIAAMKGAFTGGEGEDEDVDCIDNLPPF